MLRCIAVVIVMLSAPSWALRLPATPRTGAVSCSGATTSCSGTDASVDPRTLPGDPSLVLSTNVALKDKATFVKSASAAVASALSKPESYVAVCITDEHNGMSFGGTTDPCAVGCVYSIGSINQENNAALTAAISELLEQHGGVTNNRIYINFFDVPRANCGWSGRTFAG